MTIASGATILASDILAIQSTANAAMPNTVAALTALIASLPTTLPDSAGKLWNNGGVLSIS
jgi:hypothetical protein